MRGYEAVDKLYKEEKEKLYLPKIEKMFAGAEREKDWIRSRQGADGRIYMNGAESVNPYFACFAVQGLLSGDVSESDLESAQKYIDWHCQKFMEWDGEIPDYSMEDGIETTSEPDSVDAYIAVFLSLLAKKAEVTGNLSIQEREAVELGLKKLEALTVDGLTLVRGGDSRCYYMDNIEVLAAYQDIGRLAGLDGFGEPAKKAQERAERIHAAISETFWNPDACRYEVGIQTNGGIMEADDLERFYPDGVVQVYGTAFGIMPTGMESARTLYERFCEIFAWEKMELDDVPFQWSEISMAAVEAGDWRRVETYLDTYEKKAKTDRDKSFHTGAAGWTAKTCARMGKLYRDQMESSLFQDLVSRLTDGGRDERE